MREALNDLSGYHNSFSVFVNEYAELTGEQVDSGVLLLEKGNQIKAIAREELGKHVDLTETTDVAHSLDYHISGMLGLEDQPTTAPETVAICLESAVLLVEVDEDAVLNLGEIATKQEDGSYSWDPAHTEAPAA